ncbi:MAG TPA: phospholipase D-like domain-containing protein [Patescibacteria group bacterium]|jgi:cardiolipin synthase|nr:phospholipase D-like domain-containing protein [Patescibacteria group bacterium]
MSETYWKFYLNSHEAWNTMLSDCANARFSIDLNQYIFEPDEIGIKFIEMFLDKARQGVRVRLLLDAVGSRHLLFSDYPRILSNAGIQITFFNPISPWRFTNFTSWFFRDHKKMLIVDSQIGHTGGLGIHQEMWDWRDTSVRLIGPVVTAMEETFSRMWEITLKKRFLGFENIRSKSVGFSFLTSVPLLKPLLKTRARHRYIRDSFSDAIRRARKYIFLTTPYFVPDLGFFRTLRLAASRGIDVRILLPSRSDISSLDVAASSYFTLSFKSGIKIFKYRSRILHAKTIIVDDKWASVGSTNLDNLSFRFNYEGNVNSTNASFNAELKKHFLTDLESSEEVKPFAWAKRPFSQRVAEILTWPAHNFM